MVVSFRLVSLVNTKLRIAGANFLGEAVSEKLTRQQQTSQLPAGILISIQGFTQEGYNSSKRQQEAQKTAIIILISGATIHSFIII